MKSTRSVLRVEELDARTLPTPLVPLPLGQVAGTNALSRPYTMAGPKLSGVASGIFAAGRAKATDPISYAFLGKADLARVGPVRVDGGITAVSPTQAGKAGGVMHFGALRGSITIKLVGPQQAANSPLPTQFQYQVVSASGIYSTMQSHGTATLTLNPASGTFSIKLTPA